VDAHHLAFLVDRSFLRAFAVGVGEVRGAAEHGPSRAPVARIAFLPQRRDTPGVEAGEEPLVHFEGRRSRARGACSIQSNTGHAPLAGDSGRGSTSGRLICEGAWSARKKEVKPLAREPEASANRFALASGSRLTGDNSFTPTPVSAPAPHWLGLPNVLTWWSEPVRQRHQQAVVRHLRILQRPAHLEGPTPPPTSTNGDVVPSCASCPCPVRSSTR